MHWYRYDVPNGAVKLTSRQPKLFSSLPPFNLVLATNE